MEKLKQELRAQFEFLGSELISGHAALRVALDCIDSVCEETISEENPACPDCHDHGWLYNEDGIRVGVCPCHL